MSKTSIKERNKAIRLAWEREQKLVAQGKGTRDWSQDQQKDILDPDKGKAYDENGRAFEGQHMKSAAEYPEYQGDPDNIQFLTRDEHLEAHKDSWQNPTNWYYNPESKEFVDFGEYKPIPCAAISLSEPVYSSPVVESKSEGDDLKETATGEKTDREHTEPSRQENAAHHSGSRTHTKTTGVPPEVHESFGDKVLHVAEAVREFGEKHPVLTGVLKVVGIAAAAAGAEAIANGARGSGGRSSSSSSDDYFSSSSDDYSEYSDSDEVDIISSSRDYPDERSSPEEHTVPAHGQHYHTKDGVIWKEKESYQRGGKHDDN